MADKRIAQAFEQMTPSHEAEDRMLAGILAAAHASAEASPAVEGAAAKEAAAGMPPTRQQRSDAPASPYRPARKVVPWKVALPIAASLVLLAGLGIFAASTFGSAPDSMNQMAMESADSGSASDSAAPSVEEDGSEAAPKSSDPELLYDIAPQANGSSDAGGAAGVAAEYPYISFTGTDGIETWLEVQFDNEGMGKQSDQSLVGKSLGAATAWNADLSKSTACTVYECPTTAIPYFIVQYDGDSAYYLTLGTQKP